LEIKTDQGSVFVIPTFSCQNSGGGKLELILIINLNFMSENKSFEVPKDYSTNKTPELKESEKLEEIRQDEIRRFEKMIEEITLESAQSVYSDHHPMDIPNDYEIEKDNEEWRKLYRQEIQRLREASTEDLILLEKNIGMPIVFIDGKRSLSFKKRVVDQPVAKEVEKQQTEGLSEEEKLRAMSDKDLREKIWKWEAELEKSERLQLEYEAAQEKNIINYFKTEANRRGLDLN